MLKLAITKEACEFIKERDPKQFRQLMNKVLDLMSNLNPQDAEELKGYKGYWRADQGEYRIVYKFDAETLAVLVVDKRNDDQIYKRLKYKI